MKRELHCSACKEDLNTNVFNKVNAPGEHVKYVSGILMHDGLICDSCGKPLYLGKEVHCLSIWADYGRNPYYPWEDEYILINEEVK